MAPVKKLVAKGGKKKKQVLKFPLDCTHPVEDGIMDPLLPIEAIFLGFSPSLVHSLHFLLLLPGNLLSQNSFLHPRYCLRFCFGGTHTKRVCKQMAN
uniref:Uncharacterized protein n=1 Tax=Theropithecus gelada TaxID=9565 RepID=A0A8D2G1V6_THEGE